LYLDSTTFNAQLQIVWTQYNHCELSSKELLLALSSLSRKHKKKTGKKSEQEKNLIKFLYWQCIWKTENNVNYEKAK
jgi:hypothetical protein